MIDLEKFFHGTRDIAHNAGFFCIAYLLKHKRIAPLCKVIYINIKEILFSSILWPIKSPSYTYANSEGFTRWIYEKLFVKIAFNPHKGTNPDQTMPLLIYAALIKDYRFLLKFLLGLASRLGFYPNFEHIILKPHHLSPIFRAFRIKPFYWIADIFFYISNKIDKTSIHKSTTNKIRAYIYLIQAENSKTIWTKLVKNDYIVKAVKEGYSLEDYWKKVFEIYFHTDSEIFQNMPYGT